MKMNRFEKRFVNAGFHARRVATTVSRRFRPLALPAESRVLDLGCGNGAAAFALVETFRFRVTGVDVDPAQIETARQAAGDARNPRFEVAPAESLPFPDRSFDAVTSNMTLHHVPAWCSALDEMARVLVPGGWLVLGDLITPSGLAPALRPIMGNRAGVVTAGDLDSFLRDRGFRVAVRRSRWVHFEVAARAPEKLP
jgi:ubiquinone/menaquinone biosynthesis C-methylase UbiE